MLPTVSTLLKRARAPASDADRGVPDPQAVPGLTPVLSQPLLRSALAFCLFEVAYFYAYRFGMSFSKASASPFWFPDSVLLCALLLTRPGRWWILVLGILPIRLFSEVAGDIPSWFLLVTFAIDSAKGVLTALALRRFIKNPLRFETMQDFARFCLWAVLLIPAASALAGAAARQALGEPFWPAWEQWFLGDALTHLVVTPAILYWVFGATRKIRVPDAKRWLEGGVLVLGLLVSGYLAFGPSGSGFAEPRFYAPVPFLFWAAIRFGMSGASGAIAIMAVLSVDAALGGRGPFSGDSPAETAEELQQFLLLRAAPLYLVAILIEQGRRVEQQVQQQRDQLAYLSRVASLGELSGSLAHELNQPLTAILNNAQAAQRFLARDNADLNELREILGDIVADDRRAGEIIRGLRQLFKRSPAPQEPLDVNGLVRDSLKLAHGQLVSANVDLRTELADELPAINGDRVQLQQLLLNLINNACNAMSGAEDGDRRLAVRTGFSALEGVRVSVSDRGHGIADDNLPRIFEPFFTTRPEGMGLGLTVCRTIAIAHRGKLWAENNPDQGASFHFILPQSKALAPFQDPDA